MEREYLAVTYAEKDEAKKLGAFWDASVKKWYAPKGEKELIDKWGISKKKITELKGEEREFTGKALFIDLIPKSCWLKNICYAVHPSDWIPLKEYLCERVNHCCECCQENCFNTLEIHERWKFDDDIKLMTLVRLIALCKKCHRTSHMGFIKAGPDREEAMFQLCTIAKISKGQASNQLSNAFSVWKERNLHRWTCNTSLLLSNNIRLLEKQENDKIYKKQTDKVNLPAISKNKKNIFLKNSFQKDTSSYKFID